MNKELLSEILRLDQTHGFKSLKKPDTNILDIDLLKDLHELYYHGHLYLPHYNHIFGYKNQNQILTFFRRKGLPILSRKQVSEYYPDQINERMKSTMMERYGVNNSMHLEDFKDKLKSTNLERYGYENASQSPIIKDKKISTCQTRYGVDNPMQVKEFHDRSAETNLKRYGVSKPLQSSAILQRMKESNFEKTGYEMPLLDPRIREIIKKTNIERYGCEYPTQTSLIKSKIQETMKSPETQDKIKQTNLDRYGFEYSSQSPEIQDKTKSTNMGRYGYPYASQSPEIRVKTIRTNLERYGYPYASQSPEIQSKSKSTRKSNDSRYAKLLDLVDNEPDKTAAFVIGNYPHNHAAILRRYGLYQENLSTPEAAIREILEKHKIEYQFKFRPKFMEGKELDFFIPNKNLAIEVNGLYWHSYPKKDKYYHQDKHLRCRSEGIQLLSFTEDQILDRLEIIESMILHKLGLTPYRVYAKSCDIREIKTQEAKDFLEDNHLHGFSNASVYLGLEYEGKLVHVMSFGNNRFKKSDHPELIRSASLRFHSVAGGFQRLLKYYKRSHGVDLVESYVDFNISNGRSYELASRDLGYSKELTQPDLWFVYRNKRYRRQMFMKHNLHKFFKDFPRRSDDNYDQITVCEFLKDRGVLEYYGAGNLKYLI